MKNSYDDDDSNDDDSYDDYDDYEYEYGYGSAPHNWHCGRMLLLSLCYYCFAIVICYEAAEPEHYLKQVSLQCILFTKREKGKLMSMSSLADEGGEDRYWRHRERNHHHPPQYSHLVQ